MERQRDMQTDIQTDRLYVAYENVVTHGIIIFSLLHAIRVLDRTHKLIISLYISSSLSSECIQ